MGLTFGSLWTAGGLKVAKLAIPRTLIRDGLEHRRHACVDKRVSFPLAIEFIELSVCLETNYLKDGRDDVDEGGRKKET